MAVVGLLMVAVGNIGKYEIKLFIYEAAENIRRRVPFEKYIFYKHNIKTPEKIQN